MEICAPVEADDDASEDSQGEGERIPKVTHFPPPKPITKVAVVSWLTKVFGTRAFYFDVFLLLY